MERKCVVCLGKRFQNTMHRFTSIRGKREKWVDAVCTTPEEKTDLCLRLSRANPPLICSDHFDKDTDYSHPNPYTTLLNDTAVPFYKRSNLNQSTVPLYDLQTSSPPPTQGVMLPSSSSRPLPLFYQQPPPCCKCCCAPETKKEIEKDPNWKPDPPTTKNAPTSEYLVVSKGSLLALLRPCPRCPKGENSLSFRPEGLAVTVSGECNTCGRKFSWSSSKVLHTAKNSARERLPKLNVDFVTGAVISSVGGTKMRQVMLMSGISSLSLTTFHQIKKLYVAPAVQQIFWKTQAAVIESLIARILKGELVHIAGDGSFDSRGFSASWCRYFLLDATTQEVLHYVILNKTDTGSSGTMEVAALEQALRELSYMIGGEEGIASLVTDRHSAVTKMMKNKFPGIGHYFDPWHFFRNITLTLVTIAKANYMMPLRFWIRIIVNRCYDAVTTSQGNGEMASEKFRAILLCMTGKHTFDKDNSFKYLKACSHSAPTDPSIFIPYGGKVYNRLVDQVFTPKNIEDIKSVSWLLQTSTCESINALAWRYAAKDYFFTRSGHEMRTQLTMVHWNHLKHSAANGTRPVTSKRVVWRKVRKAASHNWRNDLKNQTYQIRANMVETPHMTHKKRMAALIKRKREIERLTRPVVPAAGDSNLEAEAVSDDEGSDEDDEDDALALPPPTAAEDVAALVEEAEEEEGDEEVDNKVDEE